ncbi:MAG: DEAD/DEAH box helicase, partial [Acidobacteriota bacterium]
RGATFFGPLHEAVGGGYPAEAVDALWNLVWQGSVTNDTFHALRAFTRVRVTRRRRQRPATSPFRSRRLAPLSAEGRWSLVPRASDEDIRTSTAGAPVPPLKPARGGATQWIAGIAQQLLARHGVLTREALTVEMIPGGFSSVYPVLRAMEESGRLRRGYFVAGLGAAQFALPGAVDLLRSLRDEPDQPEVAVLAATDPANPYGATLKWPAAGAASAGRGPTRTVGATVILVNGALAAYLARGDRQLLAFLPDTEPARSKTARAIARVLIERARSGDEAPRGMLIEEIDGATPAAHALAPFLVEAGFIAGSMGFQPNLRV